MLGYRGGHRITTSNVDSSSHSCSFCSHTPCLLQSHTQHQSCHSPLQTTVVPCRLVYKCLSLLAPIHSWNAGHLSNLGFPCLLARATFPRKLSQVLNKCHSSMPFLQFPAAETLRLLQKSI